MSDLEDALNVPFQFGLKKQGHLPVIEKMLGEGHDWNKIANVIGWCPITAREYYERTCYEPGTLEYNVLPILAAAIERLKNFAKRPDTQVWDSNAVSVLEFHARPYLKSSPKRASVLLEQLPTAEEILEQVKHPEDKGKVDDAVLFAEVTAFSDEQRVELVNFLFTYIKENRFTEYDDELTILGSAIRKCAMNMVETDFDRYGELFDVEPTKDGTSIKVLHPDIELELCKAVAWRIMVEGFDITALSGQSTLEYHCLDIAIDYSRPRLLMQQKYAAIALNAIIVAVLLGAEGINDLIKTIDRFELTWFSELLHRRLNDLSDDTENPVLKIRLNLKEDHGLSGISEQD